ncbi:probable transcriptional regulator, TetR family protein (plasmid) [Rhodococcus jostii RHA1]|uniref:DNA-binding transcriptional regulator, AcrR family n=2 Tax=Rhodococcus TaxID=1827 RepID=A0A1H4LLZ2_9NOCA|nr:probable transcriptional regulator, TetR family protein [Rhodococcus jostii RHA1]SEB71275.1 DNA-binding transcriptional regulator, AcrR family [Rhodococcus koreensis]
MATQKRAEVTRRALLYAAAEVFTRHGYADTKLSEILTQAVATKGALYFHYASKEELARAVIEEGTRRFTAVCTPYLDSATPAFEAMLGISFVTVDAALNDAVMGATFRLITEMGDYRSSETDTFATWISTYQLLARRAIDEGDLREDTDPDAVGQLLVELFARGTPPGDGHRQPRRPADADGDGVGSAAPGAGDHPESRLLPTIPHPEAAHGRPAMKGAAAGSFV